MDAPLIVPVFIPHLGCPHLCAFCNQKILTLQKVGESGLKSIPTKQIDDAISCYFPFKGNRSRVELAFYAHVGSGAAAEEARALAGAAAVERLSCLAAERAAL